MIENRVDLLDSLSSQSREVSARLALRELTRDTELTSAPIHDVGLTSCVHPSKSRDSSGIT